MCKSSDKTGQISAWKVLSRKEWMSPKLGEPRCSLSHFSMSQKQQEPQAGACLPSLILASSKLFGQLWCTVATKKTLLYAAEYKHLFSWAQQLLCHSDCWGAPWLWAHPLTELCSGNKRPGTASSQQHQYQINPPPTSVSSSPCPFALSHWKISKCSRQAQGKTDQNALKGAHEQQIL